MRQAGRKDANAGDAVAGDACVGGVCAPGQGRGSRVSRRGASAGRPLGPSARGRYMSGRGDAGAGTRDGGRGRTSVWRRREIGDWGVAFTHRHPPGWGGTTAGTRLGDVGARDVCAGDAGAGDGGRPFRAGDVRGPVGAIDAVTRDLRLGGAGTPCVRWETDAGGGRRWRNARERDTEAARETSTQGPEPRPERRPGGGPPSPTDFFFSLADFRFDGSHSSSFWPRRAAPLLEQGNDDGVAIIRDTPGGGSLACCLPLLAGGAAASPARGTLARRRVR